MYAVDLAISFPLVLGQDIFIIDLIAMINHYNRSKQY